MQLAQMGTSAASSQEEPADDDADYPDDDGEDDVAELPAEVLAMMTPQQVNAFYQARGKPWQRQTGRRTTNGGPRKPGGQRPGGTPTGQRAAHQTTANRAPKKCFNCGGDHFVTDCPKPKVDMKDRPCFKCGKTGHISRDCRSKAINTVESRAPRNDVVFCIQNAENVEPTARGKLLPTAAHVCPPYYPVPSVPRIGDAIAPARPRQRERKKMARVAAASKSAVGTKGCKLFDPDVFDRCDNPDCTDITCNSSDDILSSRWVGASQAGLTTADDDVTKQATVDNDMTAAVTTATTMLSSAGIEGFADYTKSLDVVSVDVNHDKKLCDEVIAQQDHQELRHKLLERLGVIDEVKNEVKNKTRQVTFAVGDMKIVPAQLQLFEREDPVGCVSQIMSNELWQDVEFDVALDSGSQDHVCDEVDCPRYATEPSPGSSRGQCFIVGNGGRLDNMGQRRLNMQPLENDVQQISSVFQIAKVTQPLMSVGKICDNGMRVTFDEKKAVVSDSGGAEICSFERKPGGLYISKFRLKASSPGFYSAGMSRVSPVQATVPIRPQDHSTLSVDRGRGPRRTVVRGMGEIAGRSEVLGAGDASEEVVEAEEEGQPVNSLPTPNMPTQSERDEHDLKHYPYRSWCKHCVEGRGIEMRHRVGDDHSCRGAAIVAFNYFHDGEQCLHSRRAWWSERC